MVLRDLLRIAMPEQEIRVFCELDEEFRGEANDCPWWLADMEIYGEVGIDEDVLEVHVK